MTTRSTVHWLRAPVSPDPDEAHDVLSLVTAALRRHGIPASAPVVCGHVLYPLWPSPGPDDAYELLFQYRRLDQEPNRG